MDMSSVPKLSRAAFLRLMGGAAAGLALGPAQSAPLSPAMRTRPIPATGEQIPVVGLGTARIWDVGQSAGERAPQRQVMAALFEAGASVIDTAPSYGSAEDVIGDLIAESGSRKRAFLATKVNARGSRSGISQMENSFRRLRTDRIDLMQVHNLVDWRTQLAGMRELKEAGRIRYLGITHYRTGRNRDLAEIARREPLDFIQTIYSLTTRDAENRLLPLCADRGIAVLINVPYDRGRLFRVVRGVGLPAWAAEFDCASWGQFFLKYVLSHPAVTCVIPGTAKARHMLDNLGAGRGRLPDAGLRRRMVTLLEEL